MSMSHYANGGTVITMEKMKENFPEILEIEGFLDDHGITLYEYFDSPREKVDIFDDEQKQKQVDELYQNLVDAFKTKTGLTLGEYCDRTNDHEFGDSDEAKEEFFLVYGVYEKTPAGRAGFNSGLIAEALWVTFG